MRKPLLLFVLLGLFSARGAPASTYVVRPDGTGDYPNIVSAVAAAQAGDVIELADGIFRGAGNRDVSYGGKAITIRSQSGDPNRCTINCEGTSSAPHRAFLFENSEGPSSVLEGVTITGGWHIWGGGVHCSGSSVTARISGCVFTGNNAGMSEGGGLCLEADASPLIQDCLFTGNLAGYGGGISITNGWMMHGPTIERCTIYENWASQDGGGVRL